MMRALYAGVSGLKTHQTKMDVIGNNIANVNTTAYKSSSATFSELMYQTTQSASGANAATGTAGINAKQIGLGVKAGAISASITTAGGTQTTGLPFDMRITGDAFFIVNNGSGNYFTRDGSFYVDGEGNLATKSNGYNVMGWALDKNGNINKDTVSPLKVMTTEYLTYSAEATSKAHLSGIIDKNSASVKGSTGETVNLEFYDNLGYKYTAKYTIKELGTSTSGTLQTRDYSITLKDVTDKDGKSVMDLYPELKIANTDIINYAYAAATELTQPATIVTIDPTAGGTNGITMSSGDKIEYASLFSAGKPTAAMDTLAAAYGYSTSDFMNLTLLDSTPATTTLGTLLEQAAGGTATNMTQLVGALHGNAGTITGIKTTVLKYSTADGKFSGVNTVGNNSFTLNLPYDNFSNISVDASITTNENNNGVSTVTAKSGLSAKESTIGSGRAIGTLKGISVDQAGIIKLNYSNGQTRIVGQMAVATFANASGLQKEGNNLYSATANSGDFNGKGVDVTTVDMGAISTGVLEMSNVDLSSEFTEMITTQRGFQANSRIITVSDTLLEELVNLKR